MTYIIICYSHDLRGTWIDQYGWKYERDLFIIQFLKDFPNEELVITVCVILVWVKAYFSL